MRYDGIGPKTVECESVLYVLRQLPTPAQRLARDELQRVSAEDKLLLSIPSDLRPDNDR